ncbi:hypothetical protein KJ640_03020 [bacterium]|nr:hypothetical protein [bacterium]
MIKGLEILRILFGIVLIGFGLSSGFVSYGVEDVDEVSAFHISRSDPFVSPGEYNQQNGRDRGGNRKIR